MKMDKNIARTMRRIRWVTYTLLVVAYILAFFHRVAPSAISEELQRTFMASGAELGVLAASYFYAYMILQLPAGVLVDTLGIKKIVAIGCYLAGFGALIFGTADSLLTAVIGRFLVGAGVAFFFVSTMKAVTIWFADRHFASMIGLTILLGNIGAMLGTVPLSWTLRVVPWTVIFIILSLVSLVLGSLVYLFVHNKPSDSGLPSVREIEGMGAHPAYDKHWLLGLKQVIWNRRTWPAFWVGLGQGGVFLTFVGLWAIPYVRDIYGHSNEFSAFHNTMVLAGFAAGAFFVGTMSDRLKIRRSILLWLLGGNIILWQPLLFGWQLPNVGSLILFFLLGVTTSGFTITFACVKEVNAPALSGMATGFVNMGQFMGVAFLQPLVGWVMDLSWSGKEIDGVRVYSLVDYQLGFAVLLVFMVAGFIAALRITETRGEWLSDCQPTIALVNAPSEVKRTT